MFYFLPGIEWYVCKLDTTFLLKMQLLLKYWSDFAHFFSDNKAYFSPWSEVICKKFNA